MFVLASGFMFSISNNIFIYLGLILAPDLSMVGYLINPKVGSITYNLVHSKFTSVTVIVIGLLLNNSIVTYAGLLMFAHSSMDRVLGYGLKYPDKFKHTHLD